MKKHFTILFVIVSFFTSSNSLMAQGNINVDTLEISLLGYKNDTLKKLEVRNGSPVIIKFSGLNPLKYNYALNHEFVNLFSESMDTPSEQYSLSTDKSQLGTPNLSQQITEAEEKIESLKSSKELQSQKAENLKGNQKVAALIKEDSIEIEIQKQINKRDSLENIKRQNLDDFQAFFNKYPNEKSRLGIVLNTSENSDLVNARNGYKLIVENSNFIKYQMDQILAISKSKDVLDLESLRDTIEILYNLNKRNNPNFNDLTDGFPFPDDVKVQDSRKIIVANFEEINKKFVLVSTLQVSIQSPPIDYHGENIDFIKVTLETIPVDDKANPINRIQKYDYKVWIRKGVKIDFSAGLFLSSLRDQTFLTIKEETIENEETSLYKIIEEDQGKYEFGIGSTVNFTARSPRFVNFGGSVGGYVTTNQKFRLIAGPTLVLGKMERVIFSAGIVMGEINALSNKVNMDGSFDLGDDGTVPTVQKFDFGHYFSFTYNLGKSKGKEE